MSNFTTQESKDESRLSLEEDKLFFQEENYNREIPLLTEKVDAALAKRP
ncbi:MAG: hypothetical protein ACP8RL_05535 [cyanobacterium endosymbiont of Rhopalodia inflata]